MFKIYGNWPTDLLETLYCQHNAGRTTGWKGEITYVNVIMHTSFSEHLTDERRIEKMERGEKAGAK
jgi:hypothetical protein